MPITTHAVTPEEVVHAPYMRERWEIKQEGRRGHWRTREEREEIWHHGATAVGSLTEAEDPK